MRTFLPVVGVVFAASLFAQSAHASGYLAARFGADDGTPAMANPFAVYYNPAALGGVKGTKITLDGTLVLRNVKYTRTPAALSAECAADAACVGANTGEGKLTGLSVLPFVGIATDFGGSALHGGFASYVPFGGSSSWSKVDGKGVPGAEDGPQRWHNIEGSLRALYNTAALSYSLAGGKLSLGASVSAVLHSIHTVRARNTDASEDTATMKGTTKEGRTTLDASGFNLAAALGVYWVPSDKVNVGLSYTSQPGFGETRMNGKLEAAVGALNPTTTNVDFLQTYPDIVRLGGTWQASTKTQLRFDTSFTRWSVFKDQCVVYEGKSCNLNANGSDASGGTNIVANVPRRWKDAVGLRVGGVQALNDQVSLHASAAMSTPAVGKDTMDASTIDSVRLYGTLGGWYTMSEHVRIGASYTYLYFLPVSISAAEAQQTKWRGASSGPSAAGEYSSNVSLLNVNASYTF